MKPLGNHKAAFLFLFISIFSGQFLQAQDKLMSSDKLFVQMNDGTVKYFHSLKMVTGIMMTPHLVGDGKEVIHADDIKAYRDNDHFAVSQKTFRSGRKTYLALEVLPGFVQVIATGRISIYLKQSFNGYRRINEFFVQDGINAPIVPYTSAFMLELAKDDPQALKALNNRSVPLLEKLQLTAGILNSNTSLVSTN